MWKWKALDFWVYKVSAKKPRELIVFPPYKASVQQIIFKLDFLLQSHLTYPDFFPARSLVSFFFSVSKSYKCRKQTWKRLKKKNFSERHVVYVSLLCMVHTTFWWTHMRLFDLSLLFHWNKVKYIYIVEVATSVIKDQTKYPIWHHCIFPSIWSSQLRVVSETNWYE